MRLGGAAPAGSGTLRWGDFCYTTKVTKSVPKGCRPWETRLLHQTCGEILPALRNHVTTQSPSALRADIGKRPAASPRPRGAWVDRGSAHSHRPPQNGRGREEGGVSGKESALFGVQKAVPTARPQRGYTGVSPVRVSFPHFFSREKKWGRRRHPPSRPQAETAKQGRAKSPAPAIRFTA